MKKSSTAATLFIVLATALAPAPASAERWDVGSVPDPLYEKECGSCHMAYPAGLLPERSWKRVMDALSSHFNENAELKASERERIFAYLSANSADRGLSQRSRAIHSSIGAGEVPLRITKTPYIEGLHGGLLDPTFKGRPHVKSLAECAACHPKAIRGSFGERRYIITDEVFRRPE